MGAPHRQIAGVIAPAFLLLIGAVVFFIDDDHAQVFEWREQRGTRADDDGCFAVFGLQPRGKPFAVVEARVQDFNRRVKTLTETGDSLRRQAYFRHHHQRLSALCQHIFQHAEVNFRFPGAGNPRQQPG